MADLHYESLLIRREGLTRDLPEGDNEDLRWVTNSATLIFGDHDAVLVDTFTTVAQNEELIEWVKDHDRRLTHVYLTHGHGDHVYGIGQLLEAFPSARAIGTSGTVAESRIQAREEYRDGFWGRLFPGQIPVPVLPEVFEDDHFTLEGHELQILQTGHTDTEGTTILWVPDIRLVVAGDVVYNETHMYMAESTPESRTEWITSLELVKALDPINVVAGHKYPGRADDPATIDDSIQYLTDFIEAERTTMTALELYEAVLRRHPRRANPGSLWGAAKKFKGSPMTLPGK
ncbi:MAG: MBL fold metallo-hydrolase [Acidimicrobiales bacterium]|jgi:glyoxylase-like metal-dependent hydrolase (beta-lactamase superfamily II)